MTWRPAVVGVLILVPALLGARTRPAATSTSALADAHISAGVDFDPIALADRSSSLERVATRLSEFLGVPFGVETIVAPADPVRLDTQPVVRTLHVANRRLGDVLDDLMRTYPAYRWRESAGALTIEPLNTAGDFLDTPLASFAVTNARLEDAVLAVHRIFDPASPALDETMPKVACTLDHDCDARMRDFDKLNDHRITLSMGPTTARDVLSTIARDYNGTWIVRHHVTGLGYSLTDIGISAGTVLFETESRAR